MAALGEQYGYFWNGLDRTYNSGSFEKWLRKFFTTGVFEGDMMVTASGGMEVMVASGYANINGKVMFFDTPQRFTIDPSNGISPRIDAVVVERNDTDRAITVKVVKGGYSGGEPVAPELVRSGAVYQLTLATVTVGTGATSLTQADVTDKRPDGAVCGFVAGTVKEIDFSQIQAQFDSYMEGYKEEAESGLEGFQKQLEEYGELEKRLHDAWVLSMQEMQQKDQDDFNAWFDSVKGQMEGDVGTKLAEESLEHADRIALLEYMAESNDWMAPLLDSEGRPLLCQPRDALVAGWKYSVQ